MDESKLEYKKSNNITKTVNQYINTTTTPLIDYGSNSKYDSDSDSDDDFVQSMFDGLYKRSLTSSKHM